MAGKFILCKPCLFVEIEIEAVGFCSTCAECLCSKCVIDHRKLKVTRNHEVHQDSIPENVDLIREMSEMLDCPIHKEMKISFRCNDHSICICTVCRVDTHRNCEHVHNIAKNETSGTDLERFQGNLEELKLLTASLKERKEGNIKVLYQRRADILSEQEVLIQKAKNALEELKTKLANETDEHVQVALSDIHEDIKSVEAIEQNTNRYVGILEAAKKYGDSVSPQVIRHLLTDATENENNLVKDLMRKKDHKLVFMRNEDCSQVHSLGTVSLIPDDASAIKECVELGIETTSDEVTECEVGSLRAVSKPINTPTHCLPTTSEDFLIQNQELSVRIDTDKNYSSIYGILVLTDGRLLMIDYNNSNIKLFSSDYKPLHVLRLPGNPIRICSLGGDEVAVSFLRLKRINRYRVVGNVILYDGGFTTSLFNHGIGFNGKNIVAIMCDEDFGCCNNAKNVKIRVESRNPLSGYIHGVVKDFNVEDYKTWSLVLNNTQALQFTEEGYMIIAELNRILCFSYREESRKTVALEKMFYVCKGEVRQNDIENIAIDGESIFVCTRSGSVLQLSSSDFNSNRVIVPETGEIFTAIAVDNKNGRLILGCNGKDKLQMYEFKRNF